MPDNSNNDNPQLIEELTLPREDWYDVVDTTEDGHIIGRIYKDALIENFNAIGAKLLELADLNVFQASTPIISDIEYPDTDLNGESNVIVNLKSFLEMTKIAGLPLECTFVDNVATNIVYYKQDGTYTVLKDVETDANSTNKFIFLNPEAETITARNSSTGESGENLIGVYENGRVITLYSYNFIGINALYYLSRMSMETYSRTVTRADRDRLSNYDGIGFNGRLYGSADRNKKTFFPTNNITLQDTGRY